MEWMRANKLKLNPDKTEVLLVGGSGFGEGGFDLVLNGATLPLRDKVRSLGVLLDPELSLEAQVTAVARNAFLQLRLINQLRPYLEYDCLAMVTHALVTSHLDFCNALYVGLPLKTVRTLQLVQNRAARLLTGTGRYAHMTPVLRQLHWLPIEARAQFKVLIMTYKALNGLGPGYLNERLRPYMPDRPLRSAGESLLREPSMKEIRRAAKKKLPVPKSKPHMQKLVFVPLKTKNKPCDLQKTFKCQCHMLKRTQLNADFSYIQYQGDSYMKFQGFRLYPQNNITLEFQTSGYQGVILYIEQNPTTMGQFLIQLSVKQGTLQYQFACDDRAAIRNISTNFRVDDGQKYNVHVRHLTASAFMATITITGETGRGGRKEQVVIVIRAVRTREEKKEMGTYYRCHHSCGEGLESTARLSEVLEDKKNSAGKCKSTLSEQCRKVQEHHLVQHSVYALADWLPARNPQAGQECNGSLRLKLPSSRQDSIMCEAELTILGVTTKTSMPSNNWSPFVWQETGPIFIGGLPENYTTKQVTPSVYNFSGCIEVTGINNMGPFTFSNAVDKNNIDSC
ncbi:hypothetical protein EYD10_06929, partial [Varanus komodoensis]